MRDGSVGLIVRFMAGIAAAAVAAGVVFGGIRGTPHDFSGASWSKGAVCEPCHSTHRSSSEGYSWNHEYPSDSAFTKHEGATLGVESLMCLGCHDGVTALDSFGGATGSTVMTGYATVGTDLSNDHPVGVRYPSGDTRYKAATIVNTSLHLYNGRVECGSCHDAHDNSNGRFLRVQSRDLCQTCHDYY